MLCWKPSRKFFFEFAKVKFYFAKVSRKLSIKIIICKGLPPTAARGPAGEGHQRMRVAVAKFPKVTLCESQTTRPLVFAFPPVHPLLMAVATHCRPGPAGEGHQRMRVAVAKFPKVRLCESQTPRPLVFAFPSWPGSVNRDIFAKVPRKLCERAGESQSACWRGWASKLCKKNLSWEGIPWC